MKFQLVLMYSLRYMSNLIKQVSNHFKAKFKPNLVRIAYVPIARMESIHMLLAFACFRNSKLFLN